MRNMIARAAALLAVSALLIACGGSDPMAQAISHQEKVLDLLEANKDNPEEAGNAVEKYVNDNKAALDKMKGEMEKLQEKFEKDPAAAMKEMAKHAEKLGKVMERTMKLTTENPELFQNEKVQASSAMFGGM